MLIVVGYNPFRISHCGPALFFFCKLPRGSGSYIVSSSWRATFWRTICGRTPNLQCFLAPSLYYSSLSIVSILLIRSLWHYLRSLEDFLSSPLPSHFFPSSLSSSNLPTRLLSSSRTLQLHQSSQIKIIGLHQTDWKCLLLPVPLLSPSLSQSPFTWRMASLQLLCLSPILMIWTFTTQYLQ